MTPDELKRWGEAADNASLKLVEFISGTADNLDTYGIDAHKVASTLGVLCDAVRALEGAHAVHNRRVLDRAMSGWDRPEEGA